jgi:NACHT domain
MGEAALKPNEWLQFIQYGFSLLGIKEVPAYIALPLGILVLSLVVVVMVAAIFAALAKIKEIWNEKLRPISYSPEERKRSRDGRLFANQVLREINQRNLAENWRDEEFADLEAEVEAEGRRQQLLPRIFSLRTDGLRREPSLARALERSTERLILLEGDPGSGKSVALRHVAQSIAVKASKSAKSDAKLPIFVNLKELKREPNEIIDRELIRRFVINSLNRINDRFVDEFLDQEFDMGIQSGRWIFLFDSFDELSDVLSSTEADNIIQEYSDAISDFLSGLNSCRGVIASRYYRGPSQHGWKKFRIIELTTERQQELIAKSLLKPDVASALEGQGNCFRRYPKFSQEPDAAGSIMRARAVR